MKPVIKKYYVGKEVKKQKFKYGGSGKRPSWIFLHVKEKPTFIKLLIDNEEIIYERFLPKNYFAPLNATPKEYKEFYDEYSKHYNEAEKLNEQFIKEIINEINKGKDAKILDIGAGTGLLALKLIKKGYENITLLDISKKMLNIAKSKIKNKKVKFIVSDLFSLNEIKEKYDIVLAILVLHYYSDKADKMLDLIHNKLKKGGTFISIDAQSRILRNINKFLKPKKMFKKVRKKTVYLKMKDSTKPFTMTICNK